MCNTAAKNPPNNSLEPKEFELYDWSGYAEKWHPEPYYHVQLPFIFGPNHHKPDHPNGPPFTVPEPSKVFFFAVFLFFLFLKRSR